MRSGQIVSLFNMFIWSKYSYGLTITGAGEAVLGEDSKWEKAALKASILRTRSPITWNGTCK